MAQTPAPDVAETYHAIIDGETTPVESGETLPTVNPATEGTFAEIAAGDEADIDRAVANAGEAFEDWWHRPPEERGRVLSALAELIREEQYEKVTEYLEIGREEAGEPVIGGEALDRDGYFVEPTIFDDVEHGCRIEQEEIFGPVLSVTTFGDEEEAIELANDVDYGLVAGIFTSDIGRAHRFARDVRAGQIYINEWFANGTGSPFGGYKQSGFGREKGLEAIRGYTQTKNVCARID
jgi:acyl-CoA reductase-like NAD-dependent aldehyde dehydrogenase